MLLNVEHLSCFSIELSSWRGAWLAQYVKHAIQSQLSSSPMLGLSLKKKKKKNSWNPVVFLFVLGNTLKEFRPLNPLGGAG